MKCRNCGRSDGHYIGCEVLMVKLSAVAVEVPLPEEPVAPPAEPEVIEVTVCAHPGCGHAPAPRRPGTAAPKYCAPHGTPQAANLRVKMKKQAKKEASNG